MVIVFLVRYVEIFLKFLFMVVCGINIFGGIFMYIIVGFWGILNILILVYKFNNFYRFGENVFVCREVFFLFLNFIK